MTDAETLKLGFVVQGWTPPRRPDAAVMRGRVVQLERLDAGAHADDLFAAFAGHDALWDYMPYGPFASVADYRDWIAATAMSADPVFYAIRDLGTGRAVGVASYLRITPEMGTIEVGHICFSPALQRGAAATETMYLMMDWAFAAGYRRYEWKCNALNVPSRRAAVRLGLSYEGVFRQAAVVKGRNRDTAWFATIDGDWPALRAAFQTWLAPANFDGTGAQIVRLSDLTQALLVSTDPALG
jgi:RimJ/RimL family protein N-acetyltransferase